MTGQSNGYGSLPLISIDIETASEGERARRYTDSKTYKLGNVKDPEKKAKKLEEKQEAARQTHALHWFTGKVISVAITDVFEQAEPTRVFYGRNEKIVLTDLAEHISRDIKLIGKSNVTFDIGFLVGRYMHHLIPVPRALKHWNQILDVDKFFSPSQSSSQRGSLSDYLHGINWESKPLDGASVPGMYNEILALESMGKHNEAEKLWNTIKDYNAFDAEAVAELARRYYGSPI